MNTICLTGCRRVLRFVLAWPLRVPSYPTRPGSVRWGSICCSRPLLSIPHSPARTWLGERKPTLQQKRRKGYQALLLLLRRRRRLRWVSIVGTKIMKERGAIDWNPFYGGISVCSFKQLEESCFSQYYIDPELSLFLSLSEWHHWTSIQSTMTSYPPRMMFV